MKNLKTKEGKIEYINDENTKSRYKKILSDPAYSSDKDDDPLGPWKDHESILKGNISRLDAAGLQITSLMFEDTFSKDNPPSAEVKEVMQRFLENSVGNRELNAFLIQDVVKSQISYSDYLTKPLYMGQIAYFTHKTRNLDKVDQIVEKLNRAYDYTLSGIEVGDEDRISLKEFAAVSDLVKTIPLLDRLHESGFIEGNQKLENIYKNAKSAQKIMVYLDKETERGASQLGGGVLILDHSFKKSSILNMVMSFFEKVMTLFSSHGHASMLHINSEGKAQRSHINPNLNHDKFDTNKYLYSNTYQIDITALISEENKQFMESLYGRNWKSEIATKFQVIENQIHCDLVGNFGSLSAADLKSQYMAGLADIIPFGHKQLQENDFKEIHQKVKKQYYAREENPKMLCSEFCANTIVASLVELDQQIKKDARAKLGKATEIAGIDLQQDIVKIPFGKHENLSVMHPDRLLKILQEHNCVEKVSIKPVDNFIYKTSSGKSFQDKILESRAKQHHEVGLQV